MVNEKYIHLLQPPESRWAKARHIAFWACYVLVALLTCFFVAATVENFWPIFTVAVAFIFGPKLWRSFR